MATGIHDVRASKVIVKCTLIVKQLCKFCNIDGAKVTLNILILTIVDMKDFS